MDKIECFKIKLLEGKFESPWELSSLTTIYEILCDRPSFNSNPITIVADPFLFVHDDYLYLFYEEKRMWTHGVLKMIRTNDLIKWSEPVVVLQESFHLSYPFVFEDDGDIYMIPETCEANEVRLYKADNNELTHFYLDRTILKHNEINTDITIDYSDSSIIKYLDGNYYLTTTLCINGENQLCLYVADNLKGPYREHPQSPVCISQKYGRNAGSLFMRNGRIYRVAQDCVQRYGDNIHLFEVTCLSEDAYSEQLVKDYLLDTSIGFYSEGGHQLNVVEFKNRTIVAVDAKEYNTYLSNRIVRKIKNYL